MMLLTRLVVAITLLVLLATPLTPAPATAAGPEEATASELAADGPGGTPTTGTGAHPTATSTRQATPVQQQVAPVQQTATPVSATATAVPATATTATTTPTATTGPTTQHQHPPATTVTAGTSDTTTASTPTTTSTTPAASPTSPTSPTATGTTATAATPSPSPGPSPSPSPSPTASPSPTPSPSPSPTPSPTPSLPYDPNVPAGPMTMPADGPTLDAGADWRTRVITEAHRHLGVPYVWGAETPAGWDCSGFVLWVFQHAAGVTLPRTAGGQAGVGAIVSPAEIRPGDLVFFANTYAPGISHVGISLGGDQFIHASAVGVGTIISSLNDHYYASHFAGARRPLKEVPGVPPAPAGPPVAPAQLLPHFAKASAKTGVPVEILFAIARVESGFSPRAVGPYLPQFAGTEDEHALGLMQFLPSTYRGYIATVDGITGRKMDINGIWDPESAILAAAHYLKDSGAPGDMRRALFAYNRADWYVDLILGWANYYAGGVMPGPDIYDYNGQGRPVVVVKPDNPLLPQLSTHLELTSPIPLSAPFRAGTTWTVGGSGSFYGTDLHSDVGGAHFAVDFNKGTLQRPEEDEGEPVLAVADGIVNNIYATLSGGWSVELYHRSPEGTLLRSVYLHLKDDPRISANLKVNQAVSRGMTIGHVGNTGVASTGAHLHFAFYILKDGAWASIRPEPLEGQALTNGMTIVSHNDPQPEARRPFEQAWKLGDERTLLGQHQRTWLWGPQPFYTGLAETQFGATDNAREAVYFDKARMELRPDGRGGWVIVPGKVGLELITGKVDLGDGRVVDYGPPEIPLVGDMKDPKTPTYADVAKEAAQPTLDYRDLPVVWQLTRGGKLVPFAPPAAVYLTNYDPVTGHNVADVFVRWWSDLLINNDGPNSLAAMPPLEMFDPGHPLSDPFWVMVTIDGQPHTILVQIFERWTLTFDPANPPNWQVELANVGRHYYDWRYEHDSREVLANLPDQQRRRRRLSTQRRRLAGVRWLRG